MNGSEFQGISVMIEVHATKGEQCRCGICGKKSKFYDNGKNGENIKERLRTRKYKPQPVRRVEIPKPDGGVRNLGVLVKLIEPPCTERYARLSND